MKTMPDRPIILHLLLYAFVTVVAMMAVTVYSAHSPSFSLSSKSLTTSSSLASSLSSKSSTASSSSSSSFSSHSTSQQRSPSPVNAEKPNPKMLSAVESRLLSMFGLTSRPRPSSNVLIPDYMLQLYQRQQKLNRESNAIASTVRSFRHQESEKDAEHNINEFHFHFNVSSVQDNELMRTAELRLFRDQTASLLEDDSNRLHLAKRDITSVHLHHHLQRILVYDVLQPATPSSEAILRLVDSRSINASSASGWESFDVFPAVVRWQRQPRDNYGIYVRVTRDNKQFAMTHESVRLRRSVGLDERTWHKQQPLLVTFSDNARGAAAVNGNATRWRRSPAKGGRRSNKPQYANKSDGKNCQRHSLYVDFTDVGWNDWIVAPPGYQAYYCHGQCKFPLADHLNTTNHAVVQTLMHSVNAQTVPLACCVPTELSPISMLYLDQYDKVVLKNYQDMVVEGCGCR